MTISRYAAGLLLLAITLGPVCLGTRALRRRLLPGWSGPPAWVAEAIGALTIVIVVTELLGAAGWFRLLPTVVCLAAAGAGAWWWARQSGQAVAASSEPPPSLLGRRGSLVAVVMVGILLAAWSTHTVAALHHGMDGVDTLWYHLPEAARFLHDGSITAPHYVDPGPTTAFFPASIPLLHALGILLMGSDLLSPLFNTGWLALVLLAAWSIGRPFGVAPVAIVGAALVLATPGFIATQPGGGYTDVVGLGLLLAALALVVNVERSGFGASWAAGATAALAAGLALGTKFTLLGPVAALGVGMIVLAPRGQRARRSMLYLAAAAAAGAFWYIRNLVAVGNPLPSLSIHLGPLVLPSPHEPTPSFTVAQYLFQRRIWSHYFVPGLESSLGPAWWALSALVVAGLVGGVVMKDRLVRTVALIGVASLVAYVMTPQFLGLQGAPFFFVRNVRYASPALGIGLVLLPVLLRGRLLWWVMGAYSLVLVGTQIDPSIWPTGLHLPRFGQPVHGKDSVTAFLVGVVVVACGALLVLGRHRLPRERTGRRSAMAAALALLLIAGAFLQQFYLHRRYEQTAPIPMTYRWARGLHDERIGFAGLFYLQYPLYGDDFSNYVQYIGARGPHGGFAGIHSCARWRQALNEGRYSYVILLPYRLSSVPPAEAAWTGDGRAASLVRTETVFLGAAHVPLQKVWIYRLHGRLDPEGCKDLPKDIQTVIAARQRDANPGVTAYLEKLSKQLVAPAR